MLLSTQDRRLDDPLSGNALLAYRRTSIPSIEAISIASSSSSSSSAASSLHRRAPLAPLPTQPSMLDDHLSASAQYTYPTSIQDQSIPMDTDPKQDFARLIARPIVSSRRSSVHDDSMPIPPRKRSIPGQNSNRDRAAPYPASGSRSSQRRPSNTSIATASSGRRTSLPTIHAHAPQSTALHPNNSPYLLPNTADDLYSGLSSFTFGAVSYPSASIPTDPSDMMSPHSRPSGNTSADRTPRPSISGPSGTKPSYSKTRHGKQKAKDYLDAEMGDVEDEDEDDAARQKSRSKMRAIDDGSRRPSLPTNLYIPGSGSAPSSATIPSDINGGSSSEASPISPIQRRRSRGTGSGLDSGMDDSESDPQQGDHLDLDTDVEFDLRGSDGLPITSDASSERTFGFSHDFDHYGRPHPGHIDTSGSPSERSDQMSINEDDRDDDDDDGRGVSVSPVTFSRHDYDSEGPEVDTFYVGPEQPSPPRRSSVPWDGTPSGRESRASRTSRGSRRSRDSRDQDGSGSDTSAVVASVLNSAREREDSIATITGRRASRSVDDGLNMSAEVDPFNTFNPPNGASPSSHPQTRADFRSLEAQVLASHSYQQQLLQQLHHPPPEFDHFAQFDKFDFQQPASPLTDDDQPPPNQRIPHGYPYDPLNAHALNPLNPLNPVEENATPTDVTNVLDGFNMDYILSGPNGSASSSSRRSWAPSMVNSFNGSGGSGSGGPEGRRPSTFTTASGEDAFTKHLAKNDDGYLRKRKEWSFRMESTDGKGPREFGPNPTWGAPESGVLVTVEVGSVVGAVGTGTGALGSGSVVSAGVAGLSVPVQSMGNGGSPNVGGGGSVQAGPLTKMDKRKPMEPGTQELWKQAHVGRFKVYRLVLESEQQDKAPQQRVHVRHIIDPYSIENKRGGPQSIIHKHSRVTAFSIFRVYNLFNKASRRREPGYMSASGSILLATKEVQEHYTSTRSTVRLNSHGLLEDRPRGSSKKAAGSSSSIAGSSSSRPRRSSKSRKRNEEDGHTSSNASASGIGSSSQTNSARSTATTRTSSVSAMGKSPSRSPEPPSPQSPVVRHGLPGRVHAQGQGEHAMSMSMSSTVTDPFASPVESSNPHSSPSPPHVSTNNSSGSGSGSSTSAKASSSEMTRTSTSTTLSLTTTTTSSTPPSRTLTNSTTSTSSPNRRMELDDEQPPPRTSHAEAFATIDSAYLEYMRGKPDRVHQDDPSNHGFVGLFRRRLLGQSAGKATSKPPSAGPNPAVLEGNYTPPWLTMAPRSKQEERERVIQTLNESFKDVGLLPSFKPQRSNNPKHKPRKHASSTNIFMNVPSESVYMLLPLWPGETDPASAEQDEDPASYIVHIEDRQYLLVYYVPFQDDPKKKKGDKKRTRAETHAAPTHSSSQKPPHINLSSFRVCARLVCYSDLRETGVRLPDYGLSITGSMTEAVQFLPPKSIRDKALDDVIIGVCHSRMDGMEFLTEGLTVLGLCKPPETEPVLPVREEDPIEDLEALLTPIGRSAVEMAWLGCMALTCF